MQLCDHESCTAAKNIVNNPQANVMTAGGKKTMENEMTYLSMIYCEKMHFASSTKRFDSFESMSSQPALSIS